MPTELEEVGVCNEHEFAHGQGRHSANLPQPSSSWTFSIMATPKSDRSVSRDHRKV
jgi:hypothetical protein